MDKWVMTKSMSSQLESQKMLSLASYRCEYCHRNLINELFEIEHIIPQSEGGKANLENMAVSCGRCNRNKGARTHFVDPFTHNLLPIFNPRAMKWPDHFEVINSEVVGKTSIGRATAALLFRATPNYAPPDLQWDKLETVEKNEYLYRFLNHLRYRRIQNQFEILQRSINSSIPSFEIRPEEEIIANRVKLFLQLEIFFTRSREIDVERGIQLGEALLSSNDDSLRIEVRQILSILYQQRATIKFNLGDVEAAKNDQIRSHELFGAIDKNSFSIRRAFKIPSDLKQYLRAITVQHKYGEIQVPKAHLSDLVKVAIDLQDEDDISHLTYLSDLILLAEKAPKTELETIYEMLTDLLETSGYGTISDIAKLITVRRRWWILQFILDENVWYEALISDLLYWRSINMFNEIRELSSLLQRVKNKINPKKYSNIKKIIQKFNKGKLPSANKVYSDDAKGRAAN